MIYYIYQRAIPVVQKIGRWLCQTKPRGHDVALTLAAALWTRCADIVEAAFASEDIVGKLERLMTADVS